MKTNPVPADCHAITPYLSVSDAAKLIAFLKRAFDGVERGVIRRPDGTVMHAQVVVGDSLLMIGEPQGQWKPQPAVLYHYVADADAIYKRALAAGATSVMEPTNMFYGDRSCCVQDSAQNSWWIATRIENPTFDEIQKRAVAFFEQRTKDT